MKVAKAKQENLNYHANIDSKTVQEILGVSDKFTYILSILEQKRELSSPHIWQTKQKQPTIKVSYYREKHIFLSVDFVDLRPT